MTNNELFHELYVAYMELLDEYQYEVGFNETYHKYFQRGRELCHEVDKKESSD